VTFVDSSFIFWRSMSSLNRSVTREHAADKWQLNGWRTHRGREWLLPRRRIAADIITMAG